MADHRPGGANRQLGAARPWQLDPGLLSVFAVEDRSLQLTWGWLPAADLTIEVGDVVAPLPPSPPAHLRRKGRRPQRVGRGPVGPGAVDIGSLEPATTYDVCVTGPGRPRRHLGQVTTLAPPPGPLTARLATISDTHLGDRAFGVRATISDVIPLPPHLHPYPERCTRAALTEAAAWGAETMVAKGDLTRDSEPAEFHEVGRLFAAAPIPVHAVLGNHDVRHRVDGAAILAGHGVAASRPVTAFDMPGVRVILAHSAIPTSRRGRLGRTQLDRIGALAAAAPAAVILALHHAPQATPVATFYPPGLHAAESRRLIDMLRQANSRTLVIAGHTHRNRRYRMRDVPVAEVGSTKDYPGQWAGYAIHEGGIRQVVRRVAAPDAMAWTEPSRRALYGLWGRWSASTIERRCWTLTW